MVTNAQLTDLFALTDALLQAGWKQGSENGVRHWDDEYPTSHCLVGALKIAAREFTEEGRPYQELFYQGVELFRPLGESCSHSDPDMRATPLIRAITRFNDTQASAEPVRQIVQEAAARLTK